MHQNRSKLNSKSSMNNLGQQFYKSDHVWGFYLPSLHSIYHCGPLILQKESKMSAVSKVDERERKTLFASSLPPKQPVQLV